MRELKKQGSLAKFVLFWTGVATLAVGLMTAFNGSWSIFARWYEINFPTMAGVDPRTTLLWSPMVVSYTPYVITGSIVSLAGIFMTTNGERKYDGRAESLVKFILFWAGVIVLATGLGTFLFGLSQSIIARWQAINFPTEVWVPPEIPRDIWFPYLEWNMPYIFAGILILIVSIFMMKKGQRNLP